MNQPRELELPLLPFQAYVLGAYDALLSEDPGGEFHFFDGVGDVREAAADLDLRVLQRAFRAIIDANESLRASFFRKNGRWHQVIHPPGSVDVAIECSEFDAPFANCEADVAAAVAAVF